MCRYSTWGTVSRQSIQKVLTIRKPCKTKCIAHAAQFPPWKHRRRVEKLQTNQQITAPQTLPISGLRTGSSHCLCDLWHIGAEPSGQGTHSVQTRGREPSRGQWLHPLVLHLGLAGALAGTRLFASALASEVCSGSRRAHLHYVLLPHKGN